MKEKKYALPMGRTGRRGARRRGVRDGWMDGQIKQRQQRTHIPSKKGCEGEQVWFRATEKHADKGRREKNGGGGLWLSGLALGWS